MRLTRNDTTMKAALALMLAAVLLTACSAGDDGDFGMPPASDMAVEQVYDGTWTMPWTPVYSGGHQPADGGTQPGADGGDMTIDGMLRIQRNELLVALPKYQILYHYGVAGTEDERNHVPECDALFAIVPIGYSENAHETVYSVRQRSETYFMMTGSDRRRFSFSFDSDASRLVVNDYSGAVHLWLQLTGVAGDDDVETFSHTTDATLQYVGTLRTRTNDDDGR